MRYFAGFFAALLLVPSAAAAQSWKCEHYQPAVSNSAKGVPEKGPSARLFEEFEARHTLQGRACYYSGFFEGRKTASGEIFRHARFTAAHRTLPFGTWLEVRSIATGRKILVKVNDRGPFSGGFVLDLTKAAARALGVDRARDRRVEMRVVARPGDDPPEFDPAGGTDATAER